MIWVNNMNMMKRSNLVMAIAFANAMAYGEGDGGDGSGGGIDLTSPEIQEAIKKAAASLVEQETAGLKTKNQELLNKMKDLQTKSKDFEGLDAAKIKAMMAALDQSEEAKLLAEGKIDEVIQKRIDRVSAQHNETIKSLEAQLAEATQNATTFKSQLTKNMITSVLSKAAVESGVLPEAIDDIVRRAEGVFSIDKDGRVSAVDKDGFLVKVDGLELTPQRFIDGLKKTAAYYWPASRGAGANGGTPIIDGKTDKGVAAAAEIVGDGQGFDLEAYRRARGTNKDKK